jgi:excisionase family DNA binding protein
MNLLLVDKRTAAQALSISVRSVERMISEKSLPAVRVRNLVRIPVAALLSLVAEHAIQGDSGELQSSLQTGG